MTLLYIKDPTDEIIELAISLNPLSINYVKSEKRHLFYDLARNSSMGDNQKGTIDCLMALQNAFCLGSYSYPIIVTK